MSDSIISQLAMAENSSVIAPAGCGKTEVIARAVSLQGQGRSLLLTHTHSGVRSLKDRLKRLNVPTEHYRVDTIASWALKISISFPQLSENMINQPVGDEWKVVYKKAQNALQYQNIRYIVQHSYTGIYVNQDSLILSLSELLPVRILGDPLQGIFDFGDDPLINWNEDVIPNFPEIGPLNFPWRWNRTNPELGEWLNEIRRNLVQGDEINLLSAPKAAAVFWRQYSRQEAISVCYKAIARQGSIVVLHKWKGQAHNFASKLGGEFTSMEEIECEDLLVWAKRLDEGGGRDYCLNLIEGSIMCWTGISTELRSIRSSIENNKHPNSRKYRNINQSMIHIMENPDDSDLLLPALIQCGEIGKVLYRKELWEEMQNVLRTYRTGKFESYEDTAWYIRNLSRIRGGRTGNRIVSRTLLIKGLEFDHVIIANADTLDDPKNLYVAMTRCKYSLTILSKSPIIKRTAFGSN